MHAWRRMEEGGCKEEKGRTRNGTGVCQSLQISKSNAMNLQSPFQISPESVTPAHQVTHEMKLLIHYSTTASCYAGPTI